MRPHLNQVRVELNILGEAQNPQKTQDQLCRRQTPNHHKSEKCSPKHPNGKPT